MSETASETDTGQADRQAIAGAGAGADWRPLPEPARLLYRLSAAFAFAAVAVGTAFLAWVFGSESLGRIVVAALSLPVVALAATVGAWLGGLRFARIRLRLDDDGLHVRRGLCWRSETVVPRSRVQHVDIERGPLLRRRGLAALVVHTAGTRLHAVRVVGLDHEHARRLRDALVDRDGESDDDAV